MGACRSGLDCSVCQCLMALTHLKGDHVPFLATHPCRPAQASWLCQHRVSSLLGRVQDLPIISPHGHVDAAVIEQKHAVPGSCGIARHPGPLRDATDSCFRCSGAEKLQPQAGARSIWRSFCEAWPLFDGTASGYWLRTQFESVFGWQGELSRRPRTRASMPFQPSWRTRVPSPGIVEGLQY